MPKEMRERLRVLCKRYSQSEIARRTGVPVSSVNRYLSGSRIPAEFCAALVRELQVGASWLLTGDGPTWASAVSDGTQRLAGDIEELVSSLGSVQKMRLGSLVGHDRLKLMRKLADSLQDLESVKSKLNRQSGPVMKRILEDWRLAMDADKLDEARKHRLTCEQVARLSDDPDLKRLHARLAAHHEMRFGDRESALRAQRRAVMTAMAAEDFPNEDLFEETRRFCVALRYTGRVAEALVHTQAFLKLCQRRGSEWDSYKALSGFEGFLLIELGQYEEGLAKSQAALHLVQGRYRQAIENGIAAALFFTGVIGYEALWHFGQQSPSRSNMIVELGLWHENPAQLRAALSQYDGPPRPEIHAARALILARTHRRAGAYREFLAATEAAVPERDLSQWCLAGQVACACRQWKEVEAAVMAAETAIEQLPPGAQPPALHWAIHSRTILRSMDKPRHKRLRERAHAYIADRVDSGARLFASALEESSPA